MPLAAYRIVEAIPKDSQEHCQWSMELYSKHRVLTTTSFDSRTNNSQHAGYSIKSEYDTVETNFQKSMVVPV
jgi:hypothetical protein